MAAGWFDLLDLTLAWHSVARDPEYPDAKTDTDTGPESATVTAIGPDAATLSWPEGAV